MIQRILVPLFTFVWWNRLNPDEVEYKYTRMHVYKVKGWRTAIIDDRGQRLTVTFLFNFPKEV